MKTACLSGHLGVLMSLILSAALSAEAETNTVTINGSHFSPATLTIAVGDTVVWENTDASDFPHTTTSDLDQLDPNYWYGLLASQGDTFGHTFNNAGTFTYRDDLDSSITGAITVIPSVAPIITLGAARLDGSQLLFEATGLTIGKTNVLEAATNLTSWVTIQTTVATDTSMTFTNPATLPRHFFRVVELP